MIAHAQETLRLETRISIQGAADALDVRIVRTLSRDGVVVRTRSWREPIPRRWH